MLTTASSFGGLQLYTFEANFEEYDPLQRYLNHLKIDNHEVRIELGPVITLQNPNIETKTSRGNVQNANRKRHSKHRLNRKSLRRKDGKEKQIVREQKTKTQRENAQYIIRRRAKRDNEIKFMYNPKNPSIKLQVPNENSIETEFVPHWKQPSEKETSVPQHPQQPTRPNNALIRLDTITKELSRLIYGTDNDEPLLSFRNVNDTFFSILNPAADKNMAPSATPGEVTVNNIVLKKGSIHARKVDPHQQFTRAKYSYALKNLGWRQGVKQTTAERDLEALHKKQKEVDLWCLQEAKLLNSDKIKLSRGMDFKKHCHEDYTGFMVSKTLETSRVTKLEPNGRISVLYHETLPSLIFNVYLTVDNYKRQLEEAEYLHTAASAAHANQQNMMMFGDWNNVPNHQRDIEERAPGIIETGRAYAAHEKEVIEYLRIIFDKFNLVDIFRSQHPDVVGSTNHPYNPLHAKKRLDRIYVHKFEVNNYLYKILKENPRLSTHDIIGLITKKDLKDIYGLQDNDFITV